MSNYSSEYLFRRLEHFRDQEDRASLAILRRGLSDFGRDFSIYAVVGSALPQEAPPRDIDLHLLVACLFATHPTGVDYSRSFGASAHALSNSLVFGQESLDARFSALLNAAEEDLPIRLRHMISLLKSKDIGVDYRRLLRDLLQWNHGSRWVQKKWARDYWTPDEVEADNEEQANTH